MAFRTAKAQLQRRKLLKSGQILPLQSEWYQVNGLRLHARVSMAASNASVPIVFVHGLGVSSSYFVPSAERLATSFNVYAPDLPGHGRSETPPNQPDITGLAQVLVDWMEVAGIPRATLVGQSMGCQIAVEATLRFSERVDRLVLIAPTPDPAGRSAPEQFRRFLKGPAFERLSLNWHVLKDYSRMGKRLFPEFRYMLRDPIEEKLPHVQVPTMLIRGENDPMVPARWFNEAANLLHPDRTVEIPFWGHAVQYSAPEQFTDAVLPFLASQRS